jgi:uracil phosphoribosyltransferase
MDGPLVPGRILPTLTENSMNTQVIEFQRVNVEVANAATLAVESLRKALVDARVAFVAAKRQRDRLEAEYIQAWNKAASAAAKRETA